MKKGWLCRTSYGEIVHTWWWLEEIQIEWWSRSSYDDFERSRSRDDPDPTVMIQIERWSRSCPERWSRLSDDPDPVQRDDPDRVMIQIQQWWSRSRDDPDPDDLKTKMTWRWRWLEDEDDPVDAEKKTSAKKLCWKNTFLVKRECWCICNFGMYSSMYLMYCNSMFIPGCFYYVFESCGHSPMFQSGGLIM